MRLITTVIIAFIPLSYSVYKVFHGEYFMFASMLFVTLLALWVGFAGISDVFDDEVIKALGGLSTILAVAHFLTTSPSTDVDEIDDNVDLFVQSIEISYCPVDIQPDEEKRLLFSKLKEALIEKCALQNHKNIMTLTSDLHKALRLDPVTGTIDSIHSDLLSKKHVTCKDIANEMKLVCPGVLN